MGAEAVKVTVTGWRLSELRRWGRWGRWGKPRLAARLGRTIGTWQGGSVNLSEEKALLSVKAAS